MVKIYFKPRWSKKTIDFETLQKSIMMFDGPRTFARSKVIHMMACYENKHG